MGAFNCVIDCLDFMKIGHYYHDLAQVNSLVGWWTVVQFFFFFYFRFLPQAGDGADYLEGYKDPYHVCFKCGRAGHWAQQCPGLLPDGQVSHTACMPPSPTFISVYWYFLYYDFLFVIKEQDLDLMNLHRQDFACWPSVSPQDNELQTYHCICMDTKQHQL